MNWQSMLETLGRNLLYGEQEQNYTKIQGPSYQ